MREARKPLYAVSMTPQQMDEALRRYIARRDPAADHEHVYDDVDGDPGICPQYACPFGVTEGLRRPAMTTTVTLTIEPTENDLARIRPGDRITHIDNRPVGRPRVVKGEYANGRIPLVNGRPDSAVEDYVYPDSLVGSTITVEREHAPFGRCGDCGHRMEADENTCGPCGRAEQARLVAALAAPTPKRPRKPVTRTIDGLRLVSRDGAWWTEDSRYEIRTNYGGITECDADHPVRITSAMRVEAQAHPTHAWAQPILAAIRSGKSGYYCYEGTEHQAPDTWIVWDHERNDYAGDFGSHAESFTEAARNLARYLRKEG